MNLLARIIAFPQKRFGRQDAPTHMPTQGRREPQVSQKVALLFPIADNVGSLAQSNTFRSTAPDK